MYLHLRIVNYVGLLIIKYQNKDFDVNFTIMELI